MLLTFFVAMLDNMWKGRFMAVMMIILHGNGVYCPWAFTIYANWECRGMVPPPPPPAAAYQPVAHALSKPLPRAARAPVAMDGKVIFIRPCTIHS
jgi:hypothetical protein